MLLDGAEQTVDVVRAGADADARAHGVPGAVVAGGEVIHQRVRAERAVAHADAVLGAERRRQQRGIEVGDVEAHHADAVVAALPQLVGAHAADRVEAREQTLEQFLLVGLDALPARRRSAR